MNAFAICMLFIGIGVNSIAGYSTSASAGSSSASDGSGGTYTQTSGPTGTFTTINGEAVYGPAFPYAPFPNFVPQFFPQAPFAPFNGQPAFGLPEPFIPIPSFAPTPLVPPGDFSVALNKYLNSIQKHYASGGSFTYATPGASVSATTYLGPTNDLYKQQQRLIEQWRDAQVSFYNSNYGSGHGGSSYGSGQGGSHAGGSTYSGSGVGAAATATYGPGGVHQTASLYPANPNKPNVDSRFGADSPPSGNGYFGVGTSSFSSSSDINGQKTHKHGAITTVNNNGKVTTYLAD